MIVNRKYEDVMDQKNAYKTKTRLGELKDESEQDKIKEYALYYHKDIVGILNVIKRELLLILKTNSYLKSIDKRLGNPNNTFDTINNITWKIYCRELANQD
jgi:hypothetical protein